MNSGNPLKLEIMKNVIKLISAAALLVLAGCATELNTDQTQQETRNVIVNVAGPVATKVNFTDNGTSKVEVKWNDADETFSAYLGSEDDVKVVKFTQVSGKDADGTIKFKGDVPADTPAETPVYALYPSKPVANGNPASVALILNENYTGAMEETTTFMYAKSTLGDLADASKKLAFEHLTSVVKFTLNFPADLAGSVTDVVVSAEGGIHYTARVDLTGDDPVYNFTTKGDIEVAGPFEIANNKVDVYCHVFPETLGKIKVTAKVDGTIYSGTLAGKTVEAGKLYDAKVTMEPVTISEYIGVVLAMQGNTSSDKHFLSTSNNGVYTSAEAAANCLLIDMVTFYSGNGSTQGYAIVSPNVDNVSNVYSEDYMTGKGISTDNAALNWSNRNETTFKYLAQYGGNPYDALKTATDLENLYTASEKAEEKRVFKLQDWDCVAFKTCDDRYGILMVTARTGGKNGSITIKYKVAN